MVYTTAMNFTILTYNVLFGNALGLIPSLQKKYTPDVVCLQEFEITVENIRRIEQTGYFLADYSHSFVKFFKVYGVATFYNPHTLKVQDGEIIPLTRSFYEIILLLLAVNQKRTVLKTKFIHKTSKKSIDVYNLHLTFHGTNTARLKQLKKVMENIEATNGTRLIVAGDFNYAYNRRSLELVMKKYSLQEATRNLLYTLIWNFLWIIPIPLKPDYILYKGLKLKKTIREKETTSDHFPIISRFSL